MKLLQWNALLQQCEIEENFEYVLGSRHYDGYEFLYNAPTADRRLSSHYLRIETRNRSMGVELFVVKHINF